MRRLSLVAALLAGCFFATAAPPMNVYAALWLGMAGLAWLVERATPLEVRLRYGAALGIAFGTGANLVAFHFVPAVIGRFTSIRAPLAWVALLALALEQSVRWGVASGLHMALRRRGVPSPLAFAAGVFAGTFVPAVFPWSPAGGVTPIPAMVQLAEIVGERGVTCLMALTAGLLASAAFYVTRVRHTWPRSLLLGGAALALPGLMFLQGRARLRDVEAFREGAPTRLIALVQPSTEAHERWNRTQTGLLLTKLTDVTARAERDGAELTVWPEAAYPFQIAHATRLCPLGQGAILPLGVRGPVLTGAVMSGANGDLWNSAVLCHTDGNLDPPQDKQHLLWFGETIPGLDRIPQVRAIFTRGIGLIAGKEVVLQQDGPVRAAVLNCFEDTLPDAGRDAMGARPNLLVNITNDAWFSGSTESELHLRLSALRAIESRRDLVRAVNGGVTSWVDAAGLVRARANPDKLDVLMARAALLETAPTPFDRGGDLPMSFILGASCALLAWKERHKTTKA